MLMNDTSVFTSNNPYGYQLNVNHPKINELYRRYKLWKGFPQQFPLGDKERFEFERFVLKNAPPSW